MKLFKKTNYFLIYKIENITEETSLDKEVMFYVKRFFARKFKKVKYFDCFAEGNQIEEYFQQGNPIENGSCLPKKNGNKMALAFLLEAYASMKNPEMFISEDFPLTDKIVNGKVIKIYKVK